MPASKQPTLRRIIVYAAVAVVFVFARPSPPLFVVGAALAVAGELLRVWACGHLRKNQAVVQSGPYAHVKNPLYLGTFLILVGMVLASSHLDAGSKSRLLLTAFLPFVLGVFFFYYLPHKFRTESGRLRRRFGAEWDAYDRLVPDFIPSPVARVRVAGRWSGAVFLENNEIGWVIGVSLALLILAARLVGGG